MISPCWPSSEKLCFDSLNRNFWFFRDTVFFKFFAIWALTTWIIRTWNSHLIPSANTSFELWFPKKIELLVSDKLWFVVCKKFHTQFFTLFTFLLAVCLSHHVIGKSIVAERDEVNSMTLWACCTFPQVQNYTIGSEDSKLVLYSLLELSIFWHYLQKICDYVVNAFCDILIIIAQY